MKASWHLEESEEEGGKTVIKIAGSERNMPLYFIRTDAINLDDESNSARFFLL